MSSLVLSIPYQKKKEKLKTPVAKISKGMAHTLKETPVSFYSGELSQSGEFLCRYSSAKKTTTTTKTRKITDLKQKRKDHKVAPATTPQTVDVSCPGNLRQVDSHASVPFPCKVAVRRAKHLYTGGRGAP